MTRGRDNENGVGVGSASVTDVDVFNTRASAFLASGPQLFGANPAGRK